MTDSHGQYKTETSQCVQTLSFSYFKELFLVHETCHIVAFVHRGIRHPATSVKVSHFGETVQTDFAYKTLHSEFQKDMRILYLQTLCPNPNKLRITFDLHIAPCLYLSIARQA
jgi:hypothetical protein